MLFYLYKGVYFLKSKVYVIDILCAHKTQNIYTWSFTEKFSDCSSRPGMLCLKLVCISGWLLSPLKGHCLVGAEVGTGQD